VINVARKEIAPENTAVIYARYSSANQREESIEAQVRACQEYAKRTGLQIIDIYADSAKTGTNAERENFQRMIEDSSKAKFRYVVIHKLDRFSRDRYDSVTYKRKLKINGVILRSVLENLDGSPESQILESMLEGMAAYYSQNLSRECLKGLLENGHKCLHNGGIPPLGYDVDKATRNYVVNKQEAEIVKFIFSNYSEGMGYNQILKQLNAMGHRSKRGREFGKNSLHDLLKNERYTGIYTFNLRLEKDVTGTRNPQFKPKDEWIYIKDGMPAIIDRETFDKVQTKLANNKKNAGHFKTKRAYMLAGIIKCGECDAPMYGNSHIDGRHGKEYLAYECSGKSFKKICDSKGVRKENIENYVLDQLQNSLFSANSMQKLSARLCDYGKRMLEESKDERDNAVRELEGINRRIEKIVTLVSESGISIETVREELKRLEEKKHTVEGELHELGIRNNAEIMSEETITHMIGKSKELVQARNISECRKIVSNFVKNVIVHRDRVEIKFKINVPDEENNLSPLTRIDELSVVKECKKAG
jgi:site-specific DNA recombinase